MLRTRTNRIIILAVSCRILTGVGSAFAGSPDLLPVSPDPSPEAITLLKYLKSIEGTYILTGQHNYPNTRDRNTRFARYYTGKTPVVFSIDMGHAKQGDTDSYLARPDIVGECIRQHKKGSLITICWHAVPPTAEEPVTFRQMQGTPADSLRSVQGQLTDRQFEEVLTPGTALYKQWCKQVDSVAVYLKKLQVAHVPVLWRPYHEMNGNWFWWGGRSGEYSTRRLYIQLFDRMVNYHHLNNLVWLWSMDRFHTPDMYYSQYFPGENYVDILTLDVYGNDFKKDYYDSLLVLAQGKPIALAEVGNPPSLQVLDDQPAWTFYSVWAGMVRNLSKKEYAILFRDPRILCLEDSAYWKSVNSYRAACGLAALPLNEKTDLNFTGSWIFDEEISSLDSRGSSQTAWRLSVSQDQDSIRITRTIIEEFTSARTEKEQYALDGSRQESIFWNMPRSTSVNTTQDSMIVETRMNFTRGDQVVEMISREIWSLQEDGNQLCIHLVADSPWGRRNALFVYRKEW
jgi:mannan endo-1,4-beta-mannosidase